MAEIVAFPPRPSEGTRKYNTLLIYYLSGFLFDRLASTDPNAYTGTSHKHSTIYIGNNILGGGEWKRVSLVMFTVFVDDSGTAKDQPVATAGAVVIPALQIPALDRTWESFRAKYGFTSFHSSVCAARNYKTEFGQWDDGKMKTAFARARQITKKYASAAFSFSVCKDDFDVEAPAEWRKSGGENHYTWAFRTLMHHLIRWHGDRRIQTPFEFVFDWAEGRDKEEIEMLMGQFDDLWPDKFEGHFAFKRSKDIPGLQCADLLAWTCYGISRLAFKKTPMLPIAEESYADFSRHLEGKWLKSLTFRREALREAIASDLSDPDSQKARAEWYAKWIAKRRTKSQ